MLSAFLFVHRNKVSYNTTCYSCCFFDKPVVSWSQFGKYQEQLTAELATFICCRTHTHTRLTALFSGTTQVSRYRKGKTTLDFTEARDSDWQWHQLGHMQVCTSLQRDNHASTPPLSFLQAGCLSCRPTNSVKALKAQELLLNGRWPHLLVLF